MTLATPTSAWCLRFLSGAVRGRTLSLQRGGNVIGSATECQVMLPGSEVQGRHLLVQVGDMAVTVQVLDGASARLNGEALGPARRTLMPGDVVSVGSIAFQLERSYAAAPGEDATFAESILPGDTTPAPTPVTVSRGSSARWVGAALMLMMGGGLLAFTAWGNSGDVPRAEGPSLQAVQKAIAGFDEVEVIGHAGGQYVVRGYVASRTQRHALQEALAPFGSAVAANVQSADEIVEQAHRYVDVPGVSVSYAGHGQVIVSGSTEDASLRERIGRLADDLHPTVRVSDHVNYLARAAARNDNELRDQWAAWQKVLPARLVGITEDADGTRHIQLADGSRYYEGAVLRSGAELKRIDANGLELSGAQQEAKR